MNKDWAQKANDRAHTLIQQLGLDRLDSMAQLQPVKDATGLNPSFAALLLLALLALILILVFAENLVILVAGFLVPSYLSFIALESEDSDDDKKWLTYWVVFISVEVFASPILSLLLKTNTLVFLKVVLIVVLIHEKTDGARTLYEFIAQFLRVREKDIEAGFQKGTDKIMGVINEGKDKFLKK